LPLGLPDPSLTVTRSAAQTRLGHRDFPGGLRHDDHDR
jgi:hypothetical protein